MNTKHYKILVFGQVQGVGFRPFVFRLALEENLRGWVNNSSQGVQIHLESTPEELQKFILRLHAEKPGPAIIKDVQISTLPMENFISFHIRESDHQDYSKITQIPSDIRICKDCLAEVQDPQNRRYQYPFTNCTNCGPRFSIIKDIPYDRPLTSMKDFELCSDCQEEYNNPFDRRFHAQPNACPLCGPQVQLLNQKQELICEKNQTIQTAAKLILEGNIIALKGLGGYQIICDATQSAVLNKLRKRKNRPLKPFAVMAKDIEMVQSLCRPIEKELECLCSPQGPIVLILKTDHLPEEVSPKNPYLGLMLPTTALHNLLLECVGRPLVVTSGNRSDEPICIDDNEAFERLGKIADFFLTHDRQIVRPLDDSIIRVINHEPVLLRKARGYAPDYFPLKKISPTALCLGGQLKSSISIVYKNQIIQSQYLGDLEDELTYQAYRKEISRYLNFYDEKSEMIVCDAHPQYQSSLYANEISPSPILVQHHLSHLYAVMCEHQLSGPVLGISWDGSGYGRNNQELWGGEFFYIDEKLQAQRIASLMPIKLLGGEASYREVDRISAALVFSVGQSPRTEREKQLHSLFENSYFQLHSTSIGRLLEGVSALIGLCAKNTFEGESAQKLEFEAMKSTTNEFVSLPTIKEAERSYLDWRPLIQFILDNQHRSQADLARITHLSIVKSSLHFLTPFGLNIPLLLSGGCFQNKILVEHFIEEVKTRKIYHPVRVPPNDGGISLGQAFFATHL